MPLDPKDPSYSNPNAPVGGIVGTTTGGTTLYAQGGGISGSQNPNITIYRPGDGSPTTVSQSDWETGTWKGQGWTDVMPKPTAPTLAGTLNTAGVSSSAIPSMEEQNILSEEQKAAQAKGTQITEQFGQKIQEQRQLGEKQVGGVKSQLGEARGLGFSSSRAQFINDLQDKNQSFIKQLETDRDTALQSLDSDAVAKANDRINQLREYQFKLHQQAFNEQMAVLAESRAQEEAKKPVQVSKGATMYDPKTGTFITAPTSSQEADVVKGYVTKYPDAGITLEDDLATAQQKLQGSQLYKKSSGLQQYSDKMMLKYPDAGITATDTPDQIAEKIQKSGLYMKQVGGGAGSWDTETINFLAGNWMISGKEPSFGYGAAGVEARKEFWKSVANQSASQGLSSQSIYAQQMYNKSLSSAQTVIQKQYQANSVMEKKVENTLKLAEGAYDKYKGGPLKITNRIEKYIRGELKGDASLTALENHIYEAAMDYAKIISGSAASSAGLTDSARKEADKLISASMNPAQFKAAIEAMRTNMSATMAAYKSQFESIQQEYGQAGGYNQEAPSFTPPSSSNSSSNNVGTLNWD